MKSLREKFSKLLDRFFTQQTKAAQQNLLEELFNDLYAERRKIYKVNFFRGIFFGLGSVIGGTMVIAIFIWVLSLFVNFPVIGDFFQQTQHTLQDTTQTQ